MRLARLGLGVVLAAVALCLLVAGAWSIVHPGPHDAKCLPYVLWKWRVWRFDADAVYGSMLGDTNRDRLVLGLSVPELVSRFGRLRTRADCTDAQRYHGEHELLAREIRWPGDSEGLVVLEDGRVTSLHLMKD